MLIQKTIRQIYGALKDKGMTEKRTELIGKFTNGRTTHITEMDAPEAAALIAFVNASDLPNDPRAKMFSTCYSLAFRLELTIKDADGNPSIEFNRFDELIKRLSPQHKSLKKHTLEEMQVLVTIFMKYADSTKKKAKNENL